MGHRNLFLDYSWFWRTSYMLPKRGPLTSSDYESVNLFLNHPEIRTMQ
jgi:hypothetical protein